MIETKKVYTDPINRNMIQQSNFLSNQMLPLIILLFTAAFIGMNEYGFGIKDHCIRIPFLKAFADPGLYSHDYMVVLKHFLYTLIWPALGIIVRHTSLPLEWLFFGMHVISIYGLFLAVYYLGKTLFGRDDVALLAMLMLIFRGQGLGAVSIASSIFLSRALVAPLLLFAGVLFLKEKWIPLYLLLGIAFLLHPLSTSYVIIIVSLYGLTHINRINRRQWLWGMAILLALSSPIFLWRFLLGPEGHPLVAPPEWESLLRLRSYHHIFPFSWPKDQFFRIFLLLLTFLIATKYKPDGNYHKKIVFIIGTIGCLCVIGTVFTELIPVSVMLGLGWCRAGVLVCSWGLGTQCRIGGGLGFFRIFSCYHSILLGTGLCACGPVCLVGRLVFSSLSGALYCRHQTCMGKASF